MHSAVCLLHSSGFGWWERRHQHRKRPCLVACLLQEGKDATAAAEGKVSTSKPTATQAAQHAQSEAWDASAKKVLTHGLWSWLLHALPETCCKVHHCHCALLISAAHRSGHSGHYESNGQVVLQAVVWASVPWSLPAAPGPSITTTAVHALSLALTTLIFADGCAWVLQGDKAAAHSEAMDSAQSQGESMDYSNFKLQVGLTACALSQACRTDQVPGNSCFQRSALPSIYIACEHVRSTDWLGQNLMCSPSNG